jgi:hypothetical protein
LRGSFREKGSISSGLVFGSLIEGTARNPSLENVLFRFAILGFALAEATGLFCLMMAFLCAPQGRTVLNTVPVFYSKLVRNYIKSMVLY